MKLHILGTGNAGALDCYNTCFAIENNGEYFLIDGGGGNQILKQLKLAKIRLNNIHNIFLSHNHTDHILGVVWVVRRICQAMMMSDGGYVGNLNIYGSSISMNVLQQIVEMLFSPAKDYIGKRIIFNAVDDRQIVNINSLDIEFFDIHAQKGVQFGFALGNKLVFCGDETLKEELVDFVKNKEWLIHESYCLDSEKAQYNPHRHQHCTVKEASEIAQKTNAQNLILVHTKDNDLKNRKKKYAVEAKKYFSGNVIIPDDLEVIDL